MCSVKFRRRFRRLLAVLLAVDVGFAAGGAGSAALSATAITILVVAICYQTFAIRRLEKGGQR